MRGHRRMRGHDFVQQGAPLLTVESADVDAAMSAYLQAGAGVNQAKAGLIKAGRKTAQSVATAEQRMEMVRRLVDGDPRFAVDSVEIDRGGLSYTVDTLSTLATRWPGAELFWLVGADVTRTFAKWRELGTEALLPEGGGAVAESD